MINDNGLFRNIRARFFHFETTGNDLTTGHRGKFIFLNTLWTL